MMTALPRFMIVEDELSSMRAIQLMLKRNYPDSGIISKDNPYHLFTTLEMLSPEVLVVDYNFQTFNITQQHSMMRRLRQFPGLVCIYSSHDPVEIKTEIRKIYGTVPSNFRVIPKEQPMRLLSAIKDFYAHV